MLLLQVFDLLLLLGLTLRLTRLIVVDDVGEWFVRGPAAVWVFRQEDEAYRRWSPQDTDTEPVWVEVPWRAKLVSGLTCPFCVGFWIGLLAVASLALAGGPGEASDLWRWIAGVFALNWIAAHLGARMGDTQ